MRKTALLVVFALEQRLYCRLRYIFVTSWSLTWFVAVKPNHIFMCGQQGYFSSCSPFFLTNQLQKGEAASKSTSRRSLLLPGDLPRSWISFWLLVHHFLGFALTFADVQSLLRGLVLYQIFVEIPFKARWIEPKYKEYHHFASAFHAFMMNFRINNVTLDSKKERNSSKRKRP